MNVNIPPTPPHPTPPHPSVCNTDLQRNNIFLWRNAMNANIPPTTPHLYARTTKYAYIIIYLSERDWRFLRLPGNLQPLPSIYIIYHIYIISAVIYGFFRPSVLDLAGSRFRRTEGIEGIEGTEGTWVSGRQGATRHTPPQHQTWPFLGFNLGTRCWRDWPGSREHDLVSTLETKHIEIPTV